jgi:N-formylglutamate amidohydrolase
MGNSELWDVRGDDSPIVATAIHTGHALRPEIAAAMKLDEATRLLEEDPHTDYLGGELPFLIAARRSRFEVDLNRPRDQAVYRTPDDAWGLDIWGTPLSDELVADSLAIYDAFYELLRGTLTAAAAAHGRFVVVDMHSYNHRRSGPSEPPAPETDNPEINVGTGTLDRERWGSLVDRFMADLGDQDFLGRRLDVRENIRFRGGHMSRWIHENFPGSGCALAIECKKIFMDEWTGEVNDEAMTALRAAIGATLPGLSAELGRL